MDRDLTVTFILPADEDVTKDKLYFNNVAGERKVLPVSLRNIFQNKAVTCIEYEDLTAEQEHEISRVSDIPRMAGA